MLIAALESENIALAIGSAKKLGEMQCLRALEPMLVLLRKLVEQDPSSREVFLVVEGLGMLGDARAVPPLLEMLAEREGKRRNDLPLETVINVLVDLGDSVAEDAIIGVLGSPQSGSRLRFAAATSLGSLGSKKSLEQLTKTSESDNDESVRRAASRAMASIKQRE